MYQENKPGKSADKRYRILVVDDMATNRMLVRTVLNPSDYAVFEAENGDSALRFLKDQPVDVVLLDVNMPDLNGFEVCRKIRDCDDLKFLPVIMLTSEEDTDSVINGINSGATDYLVKPFHPNELMARLAAAAERNRLSEELLVARRAAESASHSKSMFLATMSHEIRTPMNAIIGLSHLCLQTHLNKTQRNYVEKINHAAKSLLDIINDVLDFSRIEAGKLELVLEDFDIRSCFGRVDSLIGYLAREKGVHFEITIPHEIPCFLHGDAIRLGQILINLAGNAVKFTEKGSVIVTITAEELVDNTVILKFSVCDTGIGLSVGQIERLFKSYQQADNATQRKYGGSGLGLVICRQLVEMMDGQIWVESELGRGSTFYFTARFTRGKRIEENVTLQTTELTEAHKKLRKTRILIVEDNPFNQLVIEDLLGLTGAMTIIANNGQEALECLSAGSFDMVLMDTHLPVMDGLETTRRIRKNPRFAQMRIIAMTGNVTLDDRNRCLSLGMDDFIPKPIDPNRMYLTLAKWVTDPSGGGADVAQEIDVAGDDAAPVDMSMLYHMFHNNTVLVRKFGLKFIEVANATVTEMQIAQAAKDLPALNQLGHKLKSSARTIGAIGFADLCEALEKTDNDNDWEAAEALLHQISPLLQKISRQLENEIFKINGSSWE
ncbi:MAG: response regulator [Nitrosomonas sp.]|nr:MAG: response regulator [Nitrosomonas sp.]